MHAFLTRALQFAQKCRQIGMHALLMCRKTLAMVFHNVSNHVRQYAPVIQLHVRNSWQYTVKSSRICVDHAVRFTHRAIFMATSLGIRIAKYLRYYIPVFRQFLESNTVQAWQYALRFCRFCLESTGKYLHRTVLLVTSFYQNSSARLRHYLPIILQYLGARLQTAGRATGDYCRFLLLQAIKFIRAMARGFVNACVLVIRFLHGCTGRMALTVTAICRRIVAHVRHYLPIFLQTPGRGLQVTALALISSGRWCIRVAGKTVRAITVAVLSMLARAAKILRELLLAVKNLLLLAGPALKTLGRVADRYLGQGSRRLFHSSRIVAVRASERLYQYVLLTRLNKPIGIFLLLWPTLWALWIAADGAPDFPILLIFICGVALMRSAGCIINDLADREFDAHVSRTRLRPLATGKVTPKEALVVASVLLLCAFLLVLQLNRLTIGLSVIGALLAIMYPFTKRYTYMPQFFLGLTFGWAVPMAFAAQTGAVPAMGWILLMATVLWALVYDTMYAMVDREEDIKLGIKSTAILFEDADRIIIGIIQLLVMLSLLLIGNRLDFNGYYYAGLALAALLFIYQQYLIKDRVPAQCFKAFLNNNWFGVIVFGGIVMNYQYG